MINLNSKYPYLMDELGKEGYSGYNLDGRWYLVRSDGEAWTTQDDEGVESIVNRVDELESAKKEAIQRVNDQAQAYMAEIVAQFPPFERDAWPTLRQEAEAWEKDNNAETPLSNDFSAYRGMDRVEFIQRTLVKVKYYNGRVAYAGGTRQRLKDEIREMTDIGDVVEVKFERPVNG